MRYILDIQKKHDVKFPSWAPKENEKLKIRNFLKKLIVILTMDEEKIWQKEWFKIPFKELNIRLSLNRLPDQKIL